MIYLDTSVLVSAFRDDDFSMRTLAWLEANPPITFSLWTLIEFSSAFGILERQGVVAQAERHEVDAALDLWIRGRPVCDVSSDDVREGRALVRSGQTLRAGDAVHIALAARHGYGIATFDNSLAKEARRVGLEVVIP